MSIFGDLLSSAEDAGLSALDNILHSSGGSTSKNDYDHLREQIWAQFVMLHDSVYSYKAQGVLTRQVLNQYIHALEVLVNGFKTYTDAHSHQIGDSWVAPRFHDFYDPMVATLNDWRNILYTLPSDLLGSIFGNSPPGPPLPVPIPGVNPIPTPSLIPGNNPPLSAGGNTLLYAGLAVVAMIMLSGRRQ